MRVLFYSTSIQLEPVLAMMRELGRHVELHVLLELSPESWSSALFDVPPRPLPTGIIEAGPVLRECVPEALSRYWESCASFGLAVHNCRRSLHPATALTSHRVARYIRRLEPDVIHVDNVPLRFALVLWELRRYPIVLTVHDPEPHSGEEQWKVPLTRKISFPFADRFVLYNRFSREFFCRRHHIRPENVDSLLLGVHGMCAEWPHERLPEEPNTILFFGRISPYKGLEILYEAAQLVAQRIPNVRFVVAGRPIQGYRLPEPPALANGGAIEVTHDYVSNGEASQMFERSTVVACPNRDATQSGVVLTAFGFGKPVVASRVGGIPEYLQDEETGLLVDPEDPEALAQALVKLLRDPSLRSSMRAQIARRVENELSWRSVTANLLNTYRKAIAQ